MRDKTFHWLTREAFPAGDKDTRIIVVGNKVHEDASVLRLKELIDQKNQKKWNGIYLEYPLVDSGNKILWPGKYPNVAAVEQERRRIGNENAYRREYLLEIVPEEGRVVFPEWLKRYDSLPPANAPGFRFLAVGVDLAISQGKHADYTAVIQASVYGRGRSKRIYIHPHPINRKMKHPETLDVLRRIGQKMDYGYRPKLFIEGVGYQLAVVQELQRDGCVAESFLPRGSDKRERLIATTPFIQNGQILFLRQGAENLIGQLVGFGTERYDDLVDAFTVLVHKTVEKDQMVPPAGYSHLISESMLRKAYVADNGEFSGDKQLGVVCVGPGRERAAIVRR